MRFDPRAGIVKSPAQDSRRRFGRLPQDSLMCNLGIVLDISAGGMRVLCRRNPPTRVEVVLAGCDLNRPLQAVMIWSKRVGMFKREVGLRFENIKPEEAQLLTAIAGSNRLRRVM